MRDIAIFQCWGGKRKNYYVKQNQKLCEGVGETDALKCVLIAIIYV